MEEHVLGCIGPRGCVLCKQAKCVCSLWVGSSPYCTYCKIPIIDLIDHITLNHIPLYGYFDFLNPIISADLASHPLVSRPVYKCQQCDSSFSKIPALIKHFFEENILTCYFHCCQYIHGNLENVSNHAKECPY